MMKKRVVSVLLVGVLTALIYQRSAMEMPAIAAAMEPTVASEAVSEEDPGTASEAALGEDSGAALEAVPGEDLSTVSEAAPGEAPSAEWEAAPGELSSAASEATPGEAPSAEWEAAPGEAPSTELEAAPEESPSAASEAEPQESDTALESAPESSDPHGEDPSEESEYANLAIAQVNHYVNVRSKPNTDSEILGKIYNGAVAQILEVAGEEKDWFHVISGSVDGYIKAEYFLYGDAAVEAVDRYVTRYATVAADRLNVRQEPGTDSKRIGYIDRGEKVKLLERQEDWLLVQYTEDRTGYIAAEYVTVSEEFIYAKSIEEERAEQAARRELAQRMAAAEQTAPESTVVVPLTLPTTVYTSNEELRRSIVDYAMQYLGYPYVHGGRSLAGGTDCSGFTCYIYADFGYSLSRTPSGQYSSDGRSIDFSEIQPGDIICYGKSKCTHVGMYIGDGQIIHEANSRKGVVIYNADYDNILAVKSIVD